MKKRIILSSLAVCMLINMTGCVVVPARPVYYQPAYVHVAYWR